MNGSNMSYWVEVFTLEDMPFDSDVLALVNIDQAIVQTRVIT